MSVMKKKGIIIVRVWEGLGNQLFQYAYARALQLRSIENVKLCVLPDQGDRTVRDYKLDRLKITIPRARMFEKIAVFIERYEIVKKIVQYITERVGFIGYMEEDDVKYKEELKYLTGNYYLSGWFQNEKYFEEFAEIIRSEIRPRKKIKISTELKDILEYKNTVSVHIRRGDFARYSNILDREYYYKAFEVMEEHIDDIFYVVFSDELDWVMENMQFGDNVYYVNRDKKLEDYEELFIMSRCKNHIIANSTYSWWGAWLNTNKEKIVIGPVKWFSRRKRNIMPEDWIKI